MVAGIAVASAGLGMLAGVAMASRPSADSSTTAKPWRHASSSSAPRCATCGGTGKEECRLCARWSDAGARGGADRSGCGACAGTRRTPCRSCGGSGTGRRAPVRIAAARKMAPLPIVRNR
ncbi:protein disulfide-isomerase LQY1, chloroplastic-like [Phragmites australis]|uniref:protein disulfide-isomerase LQY1, chloroplastic-like n=1 Tax=Phragmites australis TaxID=29695 RepID=UPI002D79B4CD|nr:protein disulfide-isomerase LQY1, chloroplastic-like [Phragmites australis]